MAIGICISERVLFCRIASGEVRSEIIYENGEVYRVPRVVFLFTGRDHAHDHVYP
jgi:hypothetical protein